MTLTGDEAAAPTIAIIICATITAQLLLPVVGPTLQPVVDQLFDTLTSTERKAGEAIKRTTRTGRARTMPEHEALRTWAQAMDDTFTTEPRLWHVQNSDETADGIEPLGAHYVWARCEDDAENRADEDFDTHEGRSEVWQFDTRPATLEETLAWLNAQILARTIGSN